MFTYVLKYIKPGWLWYKKKVASLSSMCFYTEWLSAASQDEEERAISALGVCALPRAQTLSKSELNSSSSNSWQEIRGGLWFTLSEPIPPCSRDVQPSADDSRVGFLYLIVQALVQFRRATHATWIPPPRHEWGLFTLLTENFSHGSWYFGPHPPSLSLDIRSNVLKVKGNVALPILANALWCEWNAPIHCSLHSGELSPYSLFLRIHFWQLFQRWEEMPLLWLSKMVVLNK